MWVKSMTPFVLSDHVAFILHSSFFPFCPHLDKLIRKLECSFFLAAVEIGNHESIPLGNFPLSALLLLIKSSQFSYSAVSNYFHTCLGSTLLSLPSLIMCLINLCTIFWFVYGIIVIIRTQVLCRSILGMFTPIGAMSSCYFCQQHAVGEEILCITA